LIEQRYKLGIAAGLAPHRAGRDGRRSEAARLQVRHPGRQLRLEQRFRSHRLQPGVVRVARQRCAGHLRGLAVGAVGQQVFHPAFGAADAQQRPRQQRHQRGGGHHRVTPAPQPGRPARRARGGVIHRRRCGLGHVVGACRRLDAEDIEEGIGGRHEGGAVGIGLEGRRRPGGRHADTRERQVVCGGVPLHADTVDEVAAAEGQHVAVLILQAAVSDTIS
jgi:hypothetical protein